MAIILSTYNQGDPRWRDKKLSPSALTMGGYGCYITSFTMALHNFAISLDPGQVLEKLIAKNGLNYDGFLTYDGVMRAFPAVYFNERVYTTNDPSSNGLEMRPEIAIKKVRRLLDLGQPTILCVDNQGNDGVPDHAILAKDYLVNPMGSVTDFRIHDPDGGRELWFTEKYGPVLTKLYGYVSLIGPPIAFPDQSTDQEDGGALWKASQVRRGINVGTYSKEIMDNLLSV